MHSMIRFPRPAALAALALVVALPGCSEPPSNSGGSATNAASAETEEEASSDESLAMAATAWLSVSDAGDVYITYLDPDGRYRDLKEGRLAFSGTWRQKAGGELCFTPDQGTAQCWEHGAPGADRRMLATSSDGREIELRRITYSPPPKDEEVEDAEANGDEAGQDGA
ncbi:MAG: hypothetical protein V2I39_01220 [Erythrobacter sp.]|jgi:hypothetical protein|nr:hypothetical protein [Erythrobacter sp.]